MAARWCDRLAGGVPWCPNGGLVVGWWWFYGGLGQPWSPWIGRFRGWAHHGHHVPLLETPWIQGFPDLSVGFSFGGH